MPAPPRQALDAQALDATEPLRELAARRRQLADLLHAERCRLERAQMPAVRDSLTLVVAALVRSLEEIEGQLRAAIAADPDKAALADLLQSVKGGGPITTLTLLADRPELGHLSGKQIAALVGLAPQTRQSGKTTARARTGHGRPNVRRVLFNAARCAIRHCGAAKAFYQRLTLRNRRPGKVALTAVMRKLLVTLNAIARDRMPFKINPIPA